MAIFEWIEGWYNPHRRHSALGYRSPMNYERHALERRAAQRWKESPFNHGKSGDTNPQGSMAIAALGALRSVAEKRKRRKIRTWSFYRLAAAGCAWCYTLDEGKETEREVRNCPPKRVRSS
jgi:hypothetical protein